MTLVLVSPGGGRAAVVAAGMAAAAGARGTRVNLGAIEHDQLPVQQFAKAVADNHRQVELVIVYFADEAASPELVYRVCEAAEDADLDLVLHIAASPDTDQAVTAVDAFRDIGIEPSGLVIDRAPTDEQKYAEARQFLAAASGVPVVGALPDGAEALPPAEFQRRSVTWFDEDDAYDDDEDGEQGD